jgi:metallo-beta-lactamase class B
LTSKVEKRRTSNVERPTSNRQSGFDVQSSTFDVRRSARPFKLGLVATVLLAAAAALAQGPNERAFPAHRVIGNVYYVGSKDLASYLITTPDGHILINTGFEETVPLIKASVEALGLKMGDIKIILASHAHSDHVAGHALAQELTGAKVFVMQGDDDVIATGGKGQYLYTDSRWKSCPVDRVLKDGDEVKFGGVTLIARRTPGHTRGCTTWTWSVADRGKNYTVVVIGSPNVNPGYRLVENKDYPEIADDFAETFRILKSLPCDVFLGAHGAYYGMEAKYARLREADKNPFVDPAGYKEYVELKEKAFRKTLDEQKGADLYQDPLPAGAVQRLGTVRYRHHSMAIAYSPDGKLLASGGRDNSVRLFDAESGKELRRLIGHARRSYKPPADGQAPLDTLITATGEGGVNSVAFSPDGKTLASGGWDDTVRLWDVEGGKELHKLAAHKAMVGHVVFSPDGRFLASRGGLDGTVRLWDPATGDLLRSFTGLSNINPWRFNHDLALAISPDSKTVATTARREIVVFDSSTGAERQRIPAHNYGIALAYSPDGKFLASGGVDDGQDVYSLRIWDVASGNELRKCQLPKNEPPTFLVWDPNNNGRLAAVIAEDDMHIFDAEAGKEITRIKHYWPSRTAYTPDGRRLASAGSGPTIRLWDPATGNELALEYEGHRASVAAIAVAADGKLIASGGESIRLWSPETGKIIRKIPGGVTCLALSPDGRVLASGGHDRVVSLWNTETGESIRKLTGHKNGLCGLAFSNDGVLLASGDVQSTIFVWNVTDAQRVQQIDNKSATENLTFAFAPDNKTLLCGGAWNDSSFLPKTGTVIRINGKEVKFDGAISIQGVEMVRKEGDFVLQWDLATGKELRRFGGLADRIRSLALSPDGRLVAASSQDGRICLWDAEAGSDRLHIFAHPTQTSLPFTASPALAFSPDSQTLASAGTDRSIRLWNVTTARQLGEFTSPDGAFTSIAYFPNGKRLVSGSTDATVLIWDVGAAGNLPSAPKTKTITIQ